MTTPEYPPLTWLDVARRLARVELGASPFPSAVISARVGWFGLLLQAEVPVAEETLANALEELFPSRVSRDPLKIALEGGQANTYLEVSVETGTSTSAARQPFGVVDGWIDFRRPSLQSNKRVTPIAAALSVKGGTGRTTTAGAMRDFG